MIYLLYYIVYLWNCDLYDEVLGQLVRTVRSLRLESDQVLDGVESHHRYRNLNSTFVVHISQGITLLWLLGEVTEIRLLLFRCCIWEKEWSKFLFSTHNLITKHCMTLNVWNLIDALRKCQKGIRLSRNTSVKPKKIPRPI